MLEQKGLQGMCVHCMCLCAARGNTFLFGVLVVGDGSSRALSMLFLLFFVTFFLCFFFAVLICSNIITATAKVATTTTTFSVSPQAYRLERPRQPFPHTSLTGVGEKAAGPRGSDSRDSPGARGGFRGVGGTYAPVETQEDGAPRWGRDGHDDDLEGRRWRRRRRPQQHESKDSGAESEEEAAALSPVVNGGKDTAAAPASGEWRKGEGEGRGREEEDEEDEEGRWGGDAPENIVNGGFLTLSGGMGNGSHGSRQQEAVVRGGECAGESGSKRGGRAFSEHNAGDSITAAASAAEAVEGNGPSSLKVRPRYPRLSRAERRGRSPSWL